MKRWLLVGVILLFAPRAMAQDAGAAAPSCDQVATAVYNELKSSGAITDRTDKVTIQDSWDARVFDPVLQEFWPAALDGGTKSRWFSGLYGWASACASYFDNAEAHTSGPGPQNSLVCLAFNCDPDRSKRIYFSLGADFMRALGSYALHLSRERAEQEQAQQQAADEAQQAREGAARQRMDQNYRASLSSKYGVPACDSDELTQAVKQSVANSPSGRTHGLRLLVIEDIKDVSSFDPNVVKRACSGHADFNNGERYITFGARLIKDKGIMIDAHWAGSGAQDY